jgi:hypothetical protein
MFGKANLQKLLINMHHSKPVKFGKNAHLGGIRTY